MFGCLIYVQPPGVRNKGFHQDTRQGIFLSYVPHTDKLFVCYDKNSENIKIATHAKFDEGFNDLPINYLLPNCQHILRLNGERVAIGQDKLAASDLDFFVYPFAHKEVVQITANPKTKDETFGFNLANNDLTGCTYVQEFDDSVSSTATKAFNNNIKSSQKKLRGVYIIHINDVPVFSTAQACTQLQMLYEQFKQAQEHKVEKDFKSKITFSLEQNLQGKKLKRAIDDYHHLTLGTTKQTKLKTTDDNNGISMELDDQSTRFKIGFPIFKVFDNEEYKGKLLDMFQNINCMKLSMKMEIVKIFITTKYMPIIIKLMILK